jgi:protease I
MRKVVLVIAYKNFQDREYTATKKVLEEAGVEVKTASNEKRMAEGAIGLKIAVDLLVGEVKPADFDAVVFIGGSGALEELDNEISYNLARATIKQNKILAAICISPVILAKAGVLKNKKATVWWDDFNKEPISILKENGAEFIDKKVVVDGKIITANGPAAAAEFGRAILKILNG